MTVNTDINTDDIDACCYVLCPFVAHLIYDLVVVFFIVFGPVLESGSHQYSLHIKVFDPQYAKVINGGLFTLHVKGKYTLNTTIVQSSNHFLNVSDHPCLMPWDNVSYMYVVRCQLNFHEGQSSHVVNCGSISELQPGATCLDTDIHDIGLIV